MLIIILMVVLSAINLYMGWYLFNHRNKAFLVFHPESNPTLSSMTRFSGIALMTMGVLAAIVTISQVYVLISVVLIIDILLVLLLQILFIRFFPKTK